MKKRPLMLILIGAGAFVVLGAGGFFAYRALFSHPKEVKSEASDKATGKEGAPGKEKGGEKGAKKEGEPAGHSGAASSQAGMGPVYPLEPFVVNLADSGRPRYAKLVVQLELDSEPASAQLEALKPKVRDSLIMLFSSKTSEEMSTVGGKETLRNELIRRINSLLTAGKVVEVYFTEFVVQ